MNVEVNRIVAVEGANGWNCECGKSYAAGNPGAAAAAWQQHQKLCPKHPNPRLRDLALRASDVLAQVRERARSFVVAAADNYVREGDGSPFHARVIFVRAVYRCRLVEAWADLAYDTWRTTPRWGRTAVAEAQP